MSDTGRGGAFAWIVVAYAVALAVALLVGSGILPGHPIWAAAGADVAATVVVFGFSLFFSNSSFYDPYWSVAVPPIAIYWVIGSHAGGADVTRQVAVLVLATAWAVRLTANWARRWGGLDDEDWRYIDLRETWGRRYWGVNFLGIHLVPTLLVFLGCLPLYPALAVGSHPFGLLDLAALAVTGTAIWLEARADRELREYRSSPRSPEEFLCTGTWRYSRHPNYFGEMLFWWGLFLFGVAAAPSWWWTGIGAMAITLLFWFTSLPMIETRMMTRRPGYAAYVRTTPLVIPWPSKAERPRTP